MPETIFFLENRGGHKHLYHFVVYNLGGLYHILNKNYNTSSNSELFLECPSRVVPKPSNDICFPIKIYMHNILQYHREAFDIIKDKFILLDTLPKDNYEIVSLHGEPCIKDGISDNPHIVFPFLRNIFLDNIINTNTEKKRIFITRKSYESNMPETRHIVNENNFMSMLKKYNFEYIQLEEYAMIDKIKLFMDSEIIISSLSSALTNILFVDTTAKIIEISRGIHKHYEVISRIFGLNYTRYTDIIGPYNNIVDVDNYEVDTNKFENFLLTKILNTN